MRFGSLFFLIVTLAGFQLSCQRGGEPAPGTRPVVVLVGLDGADWSLIDPLIDQGKLPLFKELKEKGAWGTLRTATPAKSPVIWTSIATGKTKEKHGVVDFRATRTNSRGRHPLSSSLDIREPMLWEMLGERGRRSVLVNWYLSFPPQPLLGVNVSDFFANSALGSGVTDSRSLRQTVFPPGRAPEFAAGIERDYPRVLHKMNLPDYTVMYEQRVPGGHYTDFPIFDKLPELVLQEGVVVDVADRLFRTETFDLFAVYLELTDVVQHFAFMSLVDDAFKQTMRRAVTGGKLPEDLEQEAYRRIATIVCPVYQNAERILRRYLESEKYRQAYFVIVSDHGFSFVVRDDVINYNHIGQEKAPDGILIVRGPGVRPGRIPLARIYDVAPTILSMLGLPGDRSMDGAPLNRLLPAKRRLGFTTYRKGRSMPTGENRTVDEQKLQELRALGYLN